MAGDGEWLFEKIDNNRNGTRRKVVINAGILILGLWGLLAV